MGMTEQLGMHSGGVNLFFKWKGVIGVVIFGDRGQWLDRAQDRVSRGTAGSLFLGWCRLQGDSS